MLGNVLCGSSTYFATTVTVTDAGLVTLRNPKINRTAYLSKYIHIYDKYGDVVDYTILETERIGYGEDFKGDITLMLDKCQLHQNVEPPEWTNKNALDATKEVKEQLDKLMKDADKSAGPFINKPFWKRITSKLSNIFSFFVFGI